jgi:putative serine protease PepD
MNDQNWIWSRPRPDESNPQPTNDAPVPEPPPTASEAPQMPAGNAAEPKPLFTIPAERRDAPQAAIAEKPTEAPPLFTIPPVTPPAAAARRPLSKRAGGIASLAAVVVLSAALGAGFITGIDALRGDDGGSAGGGGSTAISTSLPSVSTGAPDVADVYANVSPSVVEITTAAPRNGGGLGSGVVLTTDGLILTNNHVVQGATSITVNFSDGQTATAKVIETKPNDDLAVIKVDGVSNLKAAKLGNSDKLRPGDEIIAIGNPLGLDNTVTTGVVSALNRELQGGRGEATLENLIQIDAAVNSGNSGGGLFNASGQLVGIPSAIENPTGQAVFVGVAYAIPINTALHDMTSLANL